MNLNANFAHELKPGSHRIQPMRRIRRPSEDGFTMVMVIFLLAIFTLAMAVAAPEMAKQIQLDREHETMERGKQYVRAIQLYYRKFHAYPPSLQALVDTDNIRFLRQKYKDPLTGKSDWRLIHFGQAKTQTLGFFGQPIMGAGMVGGSVLAGVGPSGGNSSMQNGGLGSASSIDGGMGSSFGGTGSSLGGGIGSPLGDGTGSSLGGASGSPFSSSPFASNDAGISNSTPSGSNGATGTNATSATGTSSTDNGSANGMGSGMGLGSGDQTFGGAGIIGVAPVSKKQSLMIFKKKDHYNEWEFVYDPLTDVRTIAGSSGPGGMQGDGSSDQNGGSSNGFDTSPSGSGFGGGGFGGPGSGGTGMNGGSGSGAFGGSGFGGNGAGGNSPTPQPQQQAIPEQQ